MTLILLFTCQEEGERDALQSRSDDAKETDMDDWMVTEYQNKNQNHMKVIV